MRPKLLVAAVLLGSLLLAACEPMTAPLGPAGAPQAEEADAGTRPADGVEPGDAPQAPAADGVDPDDAPAAADAPPADAQATDDARAADDATSSDGTTPSTDDEPSDEKPASDQPTDEAPAVPDDFDGRIAVSADGNIHDTDDWGATAATLAILGAAGVTDSLVHYDYSSHIGKSTERGEAQMTESALGGADRYGFDRSVFFDDTKDLQGSLESITAAVNASSADDPLYFIVAGPMEVAYRGIAAADEDKRQHVLVISHSNWNNTHTQGPELSHTADDVKQLGVQFEQLPDQNGTLHSKNDPAGYERFEAQTDDPDIAWVVERDDKRDISDAGMAYWLVTGNDRPTMDDLAVLLTSN